MKSLSKSPAPLREGEPLRIGSELVVFGRNILLRTDSAYALQHRFFVNDPWELMAEAIARAVPPGKIRDIAQSFRRQAEDYFRAATTGRELAVRPVLLYYAFLNLSKGYGVAKGNGNLAGKARHGISCESKANAVSQSLIKFPSGTGTLVFPELLKLLDGNTGVLGSILRLNYLMPQILPGHRLWCYASARAERFLTIQKCDILHATAAKQVWLNLHLDRNELERLQISEKKVIIWADLADFEYVPEISGSVCLQQRKPDFYSADPAEGLAEIIRRTRNRIWETAKNCYAVQKALHLLLSSNGTGEPIAPNAVHIFIDVFPGLGHPIFAWRFRRTTGLEIWPLS